MCLFTDAQRDIINTLKGIFYDSTNIKTDKSSVVSNISYDITFM